MKNVKRSPYLWGGMTGVLMILSLLITQKFFGASTTYARLSGWVAQLFNPSRVEYNTYYVKYITDVVADIILNWQVLFVVGILVGAWIASQWNRDFQWNALPEIRKQTQGTSITKRIIVAFIGGVVALFGVRLAGGCPSGHGLAGLSQLSLSGFVALTVFFVVGVIVAQIVYRLKK